MVVSVHLKLLSLGDLLPIAVFVCLTQKIQLMLVRTDAVGTTRSLLCFHSHGGRLSFTASVIHKARCRAVLSHVRRMNADAALHTRPSDVFSELVHAAVRTVVLNMES